MIIITVYINDKGVTDLEPPEDPVIIQEVTQNHTADGEILNVEIHYQEWGERYPNG